MRRARLKMAIPWLPYDATYACLPSGLMTMSSGLVTARPCAQRFVPLR